MSMRALSSSIWNSKRLRKQSLLQRTTANLVHLLRPLQAQVQDDSRPFHHRLLAAARSVVHHLHLHHHEEAELRKGLHLRLHLRHALHHHLSSASKRLLLLQMLANLRICHLQHQPGIEPFHSHSRILDRHHLRDQARHRWKTETHPTNSESHHPLLAIVYLLAASHLLHQLVAQCLRLPQPETALIQLHRLPMCQCLHHYHQKETLDLLRRLLFHQVLIDQCLRLPLALVHLYLLHCRLCLLSRLRIPRYLLCLLLHLHLHRLCHHTRQVDLHHLLYHQDVLLQTHQPLHHYHPWEEMGEVDSWLIFGAEQDSKRLAIKKREIGVQPWCQAQSPRQQRLLHLAEVVMLAAAWLVLWRVLLRLERARSATVVSCYCNVDPK